MENLRNSTHEDDAILIDKSVSGNKNALEELIKKHQDWVFNVALSFVAEYNDATDITQEVLIKIITKLSTFKKESDFRTWVYRIIKNHFLNMKRSKYEIVPMNFDQFGQSLDNIVDAEIAGNSFEVEENLVIEEAKLSCMKAMLLCLDREQRLIYIMGELFELPDSTGAEIMEITKENFRVRLHRAKKQLYNFMNNKCGLINKNNPCRCAKKTTGFIRMGFVDPVNLHFQKNAIATIDKSVATKVESLNDEILPAYRKLYMEHPFLKNPGGLESIRKLLSSDSVKRVFNFN